MFEVEWAQQAGWKTEQPATPREGSRLNRHDVCSAALLHWEEHCLECAIPICFTSCSLYVARADRKCSRFVYGIYPNPDFQGLFDYGADIRFRRWGKLEAIFYGKAGSVRVHRFLDAIARIMPDSPNGAVKTRRSGHSSRGLRSSLLAFGKTTLAKARDRYLARGASGATSEKYDAFVLECFSPEKTPFRLILEYAAGEMTPDHTFAGQIRLRESFEIVPGWNFHTLPGEPFRLTSGSPTGKLTIYPENNAEPRLIFTWLDLVQSRQPIETVVQPGDTKLAAPAAKVKCVAWDLDNTLWKGILAEDSEARLTPRPEALELIRKLDERGIIQTVVSKNNFEDAWAMIERLGLEDYFLYPAINWSPKSSNLKQIAERLNINVDTFALIDDSAFERAEVQSALPQVRVYSEDRIPDLLTFSEFDVAVSESSKKRRMSYLTEIKREKVRENFRGDYEAFLRGCEMRLRLFVPREEKHIARCLELIQRSNQLNLSNTRYSAEEFRELLARSGFLCVAMDCRDRFGEYGIVGFASIDESQAEPTLRDLVISCRVAQKRVEHTLIQWLAQRERARGKNALRAHLVKTDRNKPIRQVFDDLHFRALAEQNAHCLMELPLEGEGRVDDTVAIEVEGDFRPSGADWLPGTLNL